MEGRGGSWAKNRVITTQLRQSSVTVHQCLDVSQVINMHFLFQGLIYILIQRPHSLVSVWCWLTSTPSACLLYVIVSSTYALESYMFLLFFPHNNLASQVYLWVISPLPLSFVLPAILSPHPRLHKSLNTLDCPQYYNHLSANPSTPIAHSLVQISKETFSSAPLSTL